MTARWNPTTPIAELFQQINDGKEFSDEGNEIMNYIQLLCLCNNNVHAYGLFNETLKTWRKKTNINKTYANFSAFMTEQEEDRLSNQPTSGTTGYINKIIDIIVHDKIKIISIKWDPSISLHLKSNYAMKKTVLPISPQQQVLMQSLWKTFVQCFP